MFTVERTEKLNCEIRRVVWEGMGKDDVGIEVKLPNGDSLVIALVHESVQLYVYAMMKFTWSGRKNETVGIRDSHKEVRDVTLTTVFCLLGRECDVETVSFFSGPNLIYRVSLGELLSEVRNTRVVVDVEVPRPGDGEAKAAQPHRSEACRQKGARQRRT